MRTPANVYEEYGLRRKGILRALTSDVDRFFTECDPDRENLCLYGTAEGTWQVDLPAEEVPPELPEPALGINFARDGMARRDWLALVAVHSDSWLLAVAFYKAARMNKDQREELFALINQLPTCYEVVSGRASSAGQANRKRPAPAAAARPPQRQKVEEYDEDEDEDEDGWEDGEGDPCPGCRRRYAKGQFWIECDSCQQWWCSRCSKMTEAKANKVDHWHCTKCTGGP